MVCTSPHDSESRDDAEIRRDIEHDGHPSECVILAVAESLGADARELDPLMETLDPDALDALFGQNGTANESCTIAFEYIGHYVEIDAREVHVRKAK